jgi:uncharacterized membrane protein
MKKRIFIWKAIHKNQIYYTSHIKTKGALYFMGAFIMLVIIGLAVIWILLSKHFEQIGRFFSGMSPGDKDEGKKESEEDDVKEER